MYHEHTTDDIYLIFGLVLYIFVKDMHPIFHKKNNVICFHVLKNTTQSCFFNYLLNNVYVQNQRVFDCHYQIETKNKDGNVIRKHR